MCNAHPRVGHNYDDTCEKTAQLFPPDLNAHQIYAFLPVLLQIIALCFILASTRLPVQAASDEPAASQS